MSSFRTLLCRRAHPHVSGRRSVPLSSPSRQFAVPSALRFNSSASPHSAQDAPSKGTPSVHNAENLPVQAETVYQTSSEPSNEDYYRLLQLADKVKNNAKTFKPLIKKLHLARKSLRATELVVKNRPWSVIKNWKSIPGSQLVELKGNVIHVGSQKVPNIWLRDNCQCSSCVHEGTKQRLLDTFSIPEDISITKLAASKKYIDVTWSDGHHSHYEKELLEEAGASVRNRAIVRQGHYATIELWGNEIANAKPQNIWRMAGSGVDDGEPPKTEDDMIQSVLHNIARVGFCYVNGVDPTPEATEALLKRIAFIRETHYGGFYDFTADLALADTAYTNVALGAHTDNTYFTDPAGLQAFHLISHTDGEGGASLLVDGFKAADDLLNEDHEAYNILATVNVHAHASGNDGISIQPYRGFPVLEHDVETGALLRVRWNVSDRAAIELPLEKVGKWYAAARKFDAILKRKENEYWEQLQPGTVLIFDNWRVLHGRSSFTGKRRICGGYINRDDWVSKFKMLYFGKEKVLGRLASG